MSHDQIDRVKSILKKLASHIPASLASKEKQIFIGREIINKLSEDVKATLKSFMEFCVKDMRKRDASDIDIGGWGSNGKIWLRIQGIKSPVTDYGEFELDEFDILIQNVLMDSQREFMYDHRSIDFSFVTRGKDNLMYRNRANAYFDLDSLALNMRAINTQLRPYDGYGFHPNVTKTLSLAHSKEGLNLVTGITGSGKSTTLDSVIQMNNISVDAHIVIIASPVEFVHESKRCIIRHREVGRDTKTFKTGAVEALRQDPDIIIIGEMRDPETIISCLEAADSGHKVLSTLHTSSAIESIDRIIGEVPAIEQDRVRNRLADLLRCVISQKLVPSLDGKRVLAKEILIMTASTRSAIKNNNSGEIYQMINEGLKYGMTTMEQDLKHHVMERRITVETALSFANNKRMMQQLLSRI